MLAWLIVGGGVHGTYASHYLTTRGGVTPERVHVLDPHDAPLSRWDAWTKNTGMDYLRSPVGHHLDVEPLSLGRFAAVRGERLLLPEQRPSLRVFREHTSAVLARHGLDRLRVRGAATGIDFGASSVRVETTSGVLDAARVLLAIGSDGRPLWPAWARSLREHGGAVEHVFDGGFRREAVPASERVAVVGGGITAAQLALALAAKGPGRVTLLSRHAPRVAPFDADFRWLEAGPMLEFLRADALGRRRLVKSERRAGTMPSNVERALVAATASGALLHREGEIVRASLDMQGRVTLEIGGTDARGVVSVDRVILGTGFEAQRPGQGWLDRAIRTWGLPVAACGYPIVDAGLRWRPRLYVMGPLSELQLGPTARSIAGGRRAAEIVAIS